MHQGSFKKGMGKNRVSREIGMRHMRMLSVHDDGIKATGGIAGMMIGKRGTGKTTLNLQMAEWETHVKDGSSKWDPNVVTIPETVVWRSRKYDYWNTFFPDNWCNSFPGAHPKPVYIHNHDKNDYKFIQEDGRSVIKDHEVEVIEWENTTDLIRNLKMGAINVVFEPIDYFIPPEIIKRISLRKLKIDVNRGRPKKEDEDKEEDPEDYKKEIERIKEKMANKKFKPKHAPSPVWWFEFSERLMEMKPRDKYVTLHIDEAHQVFPHSPVGEHYHLIDWFANSMIDMRRHNISLIACAHDVTYIDWRIRYRVEFSIYMPGAKPERGRSRVNASLIASLDVGQSLIEEMLGEFGMFEFGRIPKQPPLIIVEGMPNYA